MDAERNIQNREAPEGRALPLGWGFMKKRGGQGGGDCLERCDFGLAKEIARVEQAARDWACMLMRGRPVCGCAFEGD